MAYDLNDIFQRGTQQPEEDTTQPKPQPTTLDQIYYDIQRDKKKAGEQKMKADDGGVFGMLEDIGSGIFKGAKTAGGFLGQTFFGGAIDYYRDKKEREATKKLTNAGQEMVLSDPENADLSFISQQLKILYPEEFKSANLSSVFQNIGASVEPVADLGDNQLTSAGQIREKKFQAWSQGKRAIRSGNNVYDLGSAGPDDFIQLFEELEVPVRISDNTDPRTGTQIYEVDKNSVTPEKWKEVLKFMRRNNVSGEMVKRMFGIDSGYQERKLDIEEAKVGLRRRELDNAAKRLNSRGYSDYVKLLGLTLKHTADAAAIPEVFRAFQNISNASDSVLKNVRTSTELSEFNRTLSELQDYVTKKGIPIETIQNYANNIDEDTGDPTIDSLLGILRNVRTAANRVSDKVGTSELKEVKRIKVKNKKTGQSGTILENDFDASKYERL